MDKIKAHALDNKAFEHINLLDRAIDQALLDDVPDTRRMLRLVEIRRLLVESMIDPAGDK